jgi:hypothetical protein
MFEPSCNFCNEHAQLDLIIDHLVLDFEPFKVFTKDTITQVKTYVGDFPVPKLRLPNHKDGESGGIQLSLRYDGKLKENVHPELKHLIPRDWTADKFGFSSFYLNGDSFLNNLADGKNLANSGIDALYTNLLNAAAADISLLFELTKQIGGPFPPPSLHLPTN